MFTQDDNTLSLIVAAGLLVLIVAVVAIGVVYRNKPVV
jgi:hypothetical protein